MTSLSPVERWPCLTSAWLLRQGRGFVFMFFKRSKRRYFDQAFVKLCVNGAAGVQGLQVQLGSVFGSMIGQPSFSVRVWRCDISRISPMSLNVFFFRPWVPHPQGDRTHCHPLPSSQGPHPQTQKLKANETFGYSEAACCEPRRKNKGEMGDGILKEKPKKKHPPETMDCCGAWNTMKLDIWDHRIRV